MWRENIDIRTIQIGSGWRTYLSVRSLEIAKY